MFGFCMALALLSKFTTLGFFPVGAAYRSRFLPGGASVLASSRLSNGRRNAPTSFAIAVGVCVFTIWAAYFFSFGKVPVWNVSLPAWEYFDGIRVALQHNTDGHPAWLLGEARRYGWWYYFPVALAVKTPLAMLVLLGVGIGVCWRNRRRVAYLMPLAFALGILIPAMSGNVNIGVATRAAGISGLLGDGGARAGATGAQLSNRRRGQERLRAS